MLLSNRQVIGVKTETTQNTPATLAATDYFLAEDVSPDIDVEKLKRDYKRSSLDTLTSGRGKAKATLKIRTELKGGGAAGTAYAPLDALFLACGMSETVVGSTSVTLAPVSAPASTSFFSLGKSCTIEYYNDGMKYVFAGCVGSAKIIAVAGNIVMVEFTMTGLYPTVTDAGFPGSITYLSQAPSAWVSSTILVQAYAAIVDKWEIDFGCSITPRDDAASANSTKGIVVTAREPVGSISLEGEKIAIHDFFLKMKSGTEASASFTVGGTAGNIITITLPKTQYDKVNLGNKNGLRMFDIPVQYNQNSGDDWISIAFT